MCCYSDKKNFTVLKTKHMPSTADIFVEFDILVRVTNRSLLVPPVKPPELRSHKCGRDHCLRNVKLALSRKPRKNAGKTILQNVFCAKYGKSGYCSWRDIGCVAARSAWKTKSRFGLKFLQSRMLRDVVVRAGETFLMIRATSSYAPAKHSASHDHEKWRAWFYGSLLCITQGWSWLVLRVRAGMRAVEILNWGGEEGLGRGTHDRVFMAFFEDIFNKLQPVIGSTTYKKSY